MKKVTYLTLILLVAAGCSRKKVVTPEPAPVPVDEPVAVVDTVGIAVEVEAVEIVKGELGGEAVEEIAEEVEADASGAQEAINPKLDYDFVLTDSIWVDYMIKPGDYLSLIAYNEYGNANEWRRIYNWNREAIGDDPNLIFPYNELDLKKPKGSAVQWVYDYFMYDVQAGETLWNIAGKVYDDRYAWVVLFWDNEETINESGGKLYPGMQLKVRTQLWPDFEE